MKLNYSLSGALLVSKLSDKNYIKESNERLYLVIIIIILAFFIWHKFKTNQFLTL